MTCKRYDFVHFICLRKDTPFFSAYEKLGVYINH